MFNLEKQKEFHDALGRRDKTYAGRFIVGVRTTGIFCQVDCPARHPAFENCEFFEDIKGALAAGFRPCKRCRPVSSDTDAAGEIQRAVEAVEAQPDRHWQTADFADLGVDVAAADAGLRDCFDLTLVDYARLRRTGMAMKALHRGKRAAQVKEGIQEEQPEADSTQLNGETPSNGTQGEVLRAVWIETPIGAMVAVADEEGLLLLEFAEGRGLEREVEQLRIAMKTPILPMGSPILQSTASQIEQYFAGKRKTFDLPLKAIGTPFQKSVWDQLLLIPYGKTISYADLARALINPNAFRAVGAANGANPISIIIPCHRVIATDGTLVGYGGGLKRKEWLLNHERKNS